MKKYLSLGSLILLMIFSAVYGQDFEGIKIINGVKIFCRVIGRIHFNILVIVSKIPPCSFF
jgi:hypothetical protein